MTSWLILVQNNNAAKHLWNSFTNSAMNVLGDATTRKMRTLYEADPLLLEVSFAAGYGGTLAMLKTTYELEGDRLEIHLVYRREEALRAFGRSLLDELEPLLSTHGNALREYAVRELMLGYTYLENRLTGMCDSPFDCTHAYLVCELMQLFDPSYVAEHAATIDSLWVQRLVAVVPIARADGGKLVATLEGELAAYL
ncbi:hypothetical protein CYMTET_9304 [Cymbomonas tetramitiformis]|uniref:Uncharacterized protein n=1 Tax=Cymbomonas tetramitiformis TaxID=36881 RepID=A0AAE0GT17_9CHLO|nr:hypothetical protein CYMTET_9304 [Cymbomonas tetramitiformis]